VRDLRAVSGYTYYMSQPGTREFTITLEQAGSSRPTIGNVLVAQDNRSGGAMTISYALSADALVSVRVLSASGKEVFTVTRGRADNSGENQVLWNLRDNANRAVAPGTYRVEILAETPDGERVRKIVPVNVIR
jgi:flagellar hook assembly protein FlgD